MSIALAAIVPHSPVLIPTVSKNKLGRLAKTIAGLEQLSEEIKKRRLNSLVIFSPLGLVQKKTVTVNLLPEFNCHFEDFGDLVTKFTVSGDIELAEQLRSSLTDQTALQFSSVNPLDYGCGVPLYYLARELKKIKILPLYPSRQGLSEHFAFGRQLQRGLQLSSKKIGLIASTSLSGRLTKEAPAGYWSGASAFDQKIVKALTADDPAALLNFSDRERDEAKEFGLSAIALLLGTLDGIKKTPRLIAYEHPFGVGCLTLDYRL